MREPLSFADSEAVTAFTSGDLPVNVHGQQFYDKYAIKFTDDGFWKVFDFTFLAGGPFTHTDWESGIRKAVISDKLARRLCDTVEAVGQTLRMNYADYRICGVVKEVSRAAESSYGDVWIPYTANASLLKDNISYCEVLPESFRLAFYRVPGPTLRPSAVRC